MKMNTTESKGPRVLEFRRKEEPVSGAIRLYDSSRPALARALAGLRAEMDGLTIRLAREYGRGSQMTVRAEEVAHAVQRLEWALEREGQGEGPQAG